MKGAVARLLRSYGYHTVFNRVIEGVEVDAYAVKPTKRGFRGLIVEMKVLYRDTLRRQVEMRRRLAHRIYVALPDWSITEALSALPPWTGIIAYNPTEDRADIVRKALPGHSLLASLIATSIGLELGLDAETPHLQPYNRASSATSERRMKRP